MAQQKGKPMRVFVAGVSGVIGWQLVPLLVTEGHEVVASARFSARLGEIRAMGGEPVVMDGLDATSVAEGSATARWWSCSWPAGTSSPTCRCSKTRLPSASGAARRCRATPPSTGSSPERTSAG